MSLMFKDSFIVSTITNSAETLKQKIIPKPSCFHSHSYFNKLNDILKKHLNS